jgi:hypothetical protein
MALRISERTAKEQQCMPEEQFFASALKQAKFGPDRPGNWENRVGNHTVRLWYDEVEPTRVFFHACVV